MTRRQWLGWNRALICIMQLLYLFAFYLIYTREVEMIYRTVTDSAAVQ